MASSQGKNPARKNLRLSDVRGVVKLAGAATTGAARIAEGVHLSVWRTLGVPGGKQPGQTRGITGLVYRAVQGTTQLVGRGVDAALGKLQDWFETAEQAGPESAERVALLSALNGVMGDRLAADQNPLAISMSLRQDGIALDFKAWPSGFKAAAKGKLLLLIHGLCMNDLQWRTRGGDAGGGEFDHGLELAAALDCTLIYLRYNTGLHVSQNGRELAGLLAQCVANWPVPVEDITIVAHSMGGLVTRSAVQCAREAGLDWPKRLKRIVFLGTPHHGAPLERAGSWADVLLGSTAYSAPFARLTQLRSAGITDLRYGLVQDADWQGQDRFRRKPDSRSVLPLPVGVACYTIAATTAARRSPLADRLIGDGLVPLPSALGQHADPRRELAFPRTSQWIAWRTNHMALLSSPEVTQQMLHWLKPELD